MEKNKEGHKTETGLALPFSPRPTDVTTRAEEQSTAVPLSFEENLPAVLAAGSETLSRADDSASLLQTICAANDTKRRLRRLDRKRGFLYAGTRNGLPF